MNIEDLYEMIGEYEEEFGEKPEALFLDKKAFYALYEQLGSKAVWATTYRPPGKIDDYDCFLFNGVYICRESRH